MPPVARRLVALVACLFTIALAPGRAMAHTQLDFSLPAEGTTVGDPVEEITVGFTDQVALVGNGFEVHDPQGNLLTPFVVTDDNMVFKFQLDPPLGGGLVVVDYHVRSLDGDVQEGSFSFTAAAPAPTSTPTPPVTTPPTSAAPVTTAAPTDPTTVDSTTTLPAASPATSTPPTSAPDTTAALATEDSDADDDNERTVMFAVLLGIAAVAAAFLVVRSRRTA